MWRKTEPVERERVLVEASYADHRATPTLLPQEARRMSFLAVSLWGAFMMGAIFYTQEARPPETKAFPAYLVFATVFTATALVAFGVLSLLVESLDLAGRLAHPLAATAFQAAVFLPAFLLARRQLRKPLRRAEVPDRPDMGKQF
jgi:hypothetical protein